MRTTVPCATAFAGTCAVSCADSEMLMIAINDATTPPARLDIEISWERMLCHWMEGKDILAARVQLMGGAGVKPITLRDWNPQQPAYPPSANRNALLQ